MFAALLVVYNNAMNSWPRFHGALYVPANLLLTAASIAVGLLSWELPISALGLGGGQPGALAMGVAAGTLLSLPLFLASTSAKGSAAVADERVAQLSPAELAFRATVRVPLGTALPEEALFRGVLYAMALPYGSAEAAVVSSLAFGLWHIAPTRNLLQQNGIIPGRSRLAVVGIVAGAVLVTAAAGWFLVWLRVQTGGIAAGLGVHASLNSLGTVAAHLASRRTRATA